jgi:hypothetical protein
MNQIPATTPAPSDDASEEAAFEVMRTDAVLTGRAVSSGQAMSSGEFWTGLLAAALVDTAGSPRKLPADMWPDQDPAVVQEIWDRAAAVVSRAAQFAASPWLHRDRLQSLQAQLTEAGFHAMAGSVGRSVRLVVADDALHPADAEIGREH